MRSRRLMRNVEVQSTSFSSWTSERTLLRQFIVNIDVLDVQIDCITQTIFATTRCGQHVDAGIIGFLSTKGASATTLTNCKSSIRISPPPQTLPLLSPFLRPLPALPARMPERLQSPTTHDEHYAPHDDDPEAWRWELYPGAQVELKNSKGDWKLAEVVVITGNEVAFFFVGEVDPATGKPRGKTLHIESPFLRPVEDDHSEVIARQAEIDLNPIAPLEFWRKQLEPGSMCEMQASSGEWKMAEVVDINEDKLKVIFVGEIDPATNQPRGKVVDRKSIYIRDMRVLPSAPVRPAALGFSAGGVGDEEVGREVSGQDDGAGASTKEVPGAVPSASEQAVETRAISFEDQFKEAIANDEGAASSGREIGTRAAPRRDIGTRAAPRRVLSADDEDDSSPEDGSPVVVGTGRPAPVQKPWSSSPTTAKTASAEVDEDVEQAFVSFKPGSGGGK